LWTDTIEAHRRQVHAAVVTAAAALVARHGIRGVTMSRIAETAGIGRATLYKYFPDVETILVAWHEERISAHLAELQEARGRGGSPLEQLRRVLEAFAMMTHRWGRHESSAAIVSVLHQGESVTHAEQAVRTLVGELVVAAIGDGTVRDDVPAEELTSFCLQTAAGAQFLSTQAAVHRMVELIMAGLLPPRPADVRSGDRGRTAPSGATGE
jgi:AcrR family transcriptional regulator